MRNTEPTIQAHAKRPLFKASNRHNSLLETNRRKYAGTLAVNHRPAESWFRVFPSGGWRMRRCRITGVQDQVVGRSSRCPAGIAVRPSGGWGWRAPAKPAIEVTTDFGAGSAGEKLVPPEPQPGRSPSASASEPYVYKKGTPDGNNPKFATTNEHFFMRASRRRGRRGIAPAVYRKRLRNPG